MKTTRTARVLSSGDHRAQDEWFVLHGYAQTAAEALEPFLAARADEHVLAPEALSRFYRRGFRGEVGASWMTKHEREHEIDDALHYLDRAREELGSKNARRRHVLGFSQGGATAARWAARGRRRPHRLVLWCSDLPPDLEEEDLHALRDTELWIVSAPDDPMLPRERIDEGIARLRSVGIEPHTFSSRAGHALDPGDVEEVWDRWRAIDRGSDSDQAPNPGVDA